MKKLVFLVILSVCVICCISSITSSIYGYEGNRLKSEGVCDKNILLCPLNEKISDRDYRARLISYMNSGTLRFSDHVLNSYYSEANLEPVFVYCNKDCTRFEVKEDDYVDISEEMLIYRSFYYPDEQDNENYKLYGTEPVPENEEVPEKIYYFYFDMDTIIEFFTKSNSFLSVSDIENFFVERGFVFANRNIPRNIHKKDIYYSV